MWIVRLALRRPYTFVVMALLILILGPLAVYRTPTDIFPDIDIPIVSVIWTYTGLSADEMSTRIVGAYERGLTATVNDIEHIESVSLNGVGVVKVYFHPDVRIDMAMTQVSALAQAALRSDPPGTTPPFIITYNASSVPILQLALSGENLSEQQLNDMAGNFMRVQLATVQGAVLPNPYGGKQRQIQVDLNNAALQARGLSPADVVSAIGTQNLIVPGGTVKIGAVESDVDLNGSPKTVEEMNDLPIKTVGNSTIYVRDAAHVRDGNPPQSNIVHVNGQRATLLSILKSGNASTLDVITRIKEAMPRIREALPRELKISLIGDQSLFVRAAVTGGARGAVRSLCLTGLLIFVFLGSWRSPLIIAVSIPLSILSSLIVLSPIGQTINIMTLGGLALAVGILVDDATVVIENINRNLAMGKEAIQAILEGSQEIAVPAFVSTLSICIVFVPMFFLTGVARYLFVPLAEAVVFAMLASYFLSRTLVPTMARFLLSAADEVAPEEGKQGFLRRYQQKFEHAFERMRERYRDALRAALATPMLFAGCFLAFCVLSTLLVFVLGRDFFPSVDACQIRLHFRARTGLRIEETARLADQVDGFIRKTIPQGEVETILDNLGVPYSGLNLSYSNAGTFGTSDAEILVQLTPERQKPTSTYINDLREQLPQDFPGVQFFFQPADIVTQILNFGSPAPIDVQVTGNNQQGNYVVGEKLANELRHIPGAADVHVQQAFDQPTLHMDIERTRVQNLGLQAKDVAQNLLVSLSSSFQTAPAFWLDPKNGVSYNVAVQTPQYRVDTYQALQNTPVTASTANLPPQILANLVTTSTTARPAVVSHYNVQPMINVYSSVEGRDLGGVADQVENRVKEMEKQLPKETPMFIGGKVQPRKPPSP